jgi:hypothetical protein
MSKTIVHVNQISTPGLNAFVEDVNYFRVDASRRLDAKRRVELGQFFTSPSLGRFMASMFEARSQNVRLLDAGTGVAAQYGQEQKYGTGCFEPNSEVKRPSLSKLLIVHVGHLDIVLSMRLNECSAELKRWTQCIKGRSGE